MNFRIYDVNVNRLNESLRVIEDIARFEFNDKDLTLIVKKIRHELKNKLQRENIRNKLIEARDTSKDTAKYLNPEEEFKRGSIDDVVTANLKRIQESSRVMEEMCKIAHQSLSRFFKKIRFQFYKIEKEIYKKYFQKDRG
ncbi:MAG: thiamine-phosphate pyrophosphorylase [Spirochaetes bacterium]|nr:thiamine-phosphate pyrophosphorylase [Spirochaetota bacterium]